MMSIARILNWFIAFGFLASSALGADLRTTSGKRLVVRRISQQADEPKKAAEKQPMQPAPMGEDKKAAPAPMPMAEDVESIVEYDSEYYDISPGIGSNCASCSRWASVEYLLWWRRGAELPPLVTTSPANTAQNDAGVLGLQTTTTLFGGERFDAQSSPGGRVSFGYWVDPCQQVGYGVRFYSLADDDFSYSIGPTDRPITARPFFNVSSNLQDARLVNFPGLSEGTITVTGTSEVLGGDVFYRKAWCRTGRARLDIIGGYQFARVNESVRIDSQTTITATGGTVPQGTVIDSFDLFEAENEFHGGSIGLMAEITGSCWTVQLLGKVGLGNMRQRMRINGQTVTDAVGTVSTVAAGLLAQPSNIGIFERDEFSSVPEFGINCAWDIACNVRLHAGYSVVYWSDVLRPGDHMDLNVNPTQLPGPIAGDPAPVFGFRPTSFWVHGVNLGLSFTF